MSVRLQRDKDLRPIAFIPIKWLDEDARWIITDEERAEYAKLATDDQRDAFIEQFWQHRNPTSGPENPYKEEHYRRIGYANTHFAAGVLTQTIATNEDRRSE